MTETITGLYSKVITRTYEATGMIGRYKGIDVKDTPVDAIHYDVDYGYDTMGRFSTLTNGSDVYTYNYLANSNFVASIDYPHNIKVENTYESNRNLITQVKNSVSNVTPVTTISNYDYINDALGRRTSMAKYGTAFTASDTINYGYDDKSQVISADAVTDNNYDFGFYYDQIGNRTSADSTESGSNVQTSYVANNLNQYTSITEGANPAVNPSMDADGNMLTMTLASGSWTNTFNAENRIIIQEKSDEKLEYVYDYMGRRVEKKVYSGSVGNWVLDEHLKFVYDKYLQIEELDALSSNAVAKKRIWSNGKIIADIHGTVAYYAVGDANKNITDYIDATGTVQAHYEYSPFGKITKSTGSMQDDFDYRFSSEVFDTETGLSYYNYRYYSPELGRWLNRDPINQMGSMKWWADNPERILLQKRLSQIEKIISIFSKLNTRLATPFHKLTIAIVKAREVSLFFQYEIQMDLLGKYKNKNNDNPYNYINNNPINNWDRLGAGYWDDFINYLFPPDDTHDPNNIICDCNSCQEQAIAEVATQESSTVSNSVAILNIASAENEVEQSLSLGAYLTGVIWPILNPFAGVQTTFNAIGDGVEDTNNNSNDGEDETTLLLLQQLEAMDNDGLELCD